MTGGARFPPLGPEKALPSRVWETQIGFPGLSGFPLKAETCNASVAD